MTVLTEIYWHWGWSRWSFPLPSRLLQLTGHAMALRMLPAGKGAPQAP